MSMEKIAPKATPKKGPEATDPAYIAQRLKGLARLVFHASNDCANADPIDREAAFFISTEMEAMADALVAQ